MRQLLPLLSVLIVPAASRACLWDYDTLKQERARFPDTLELITGKFLRHSPEFYQWRIQDRLKKLKADPNNSNLHDDLAVAYAKTGQYEKAIDTMEKLEKIQPGRYETYSNLGTFYFLKGDIEKALPIIDKALAIDPDAHFGREKYQRWLGEYLLSRPIKDGKFIFPMTQDAHRDRDWDNRSRDFEEFLRTKLNQKERLTAQQRKEAITGVLGMMRFADFESPILLEVLGDLLSKPFVPDDDAKRLAARAYLKAAKSVGDKTAASKYREHSRLILMFQTQHPATTAAVHVEDVEARLETELADASEWYQELRTREQGWIQSGADPEAEFDKMYVVEPTLEDEPGDQIIRPWYDVHNEELRVAGGIGGAILGILLLTVLGLWIRRHL